MLGGRRADRLQLCREEALVDLALIDRDSLFDADPDDLGAVDSELLRQLLRREVVRLDAPSSREMKKPTGASLRRWAW